MTPLCTLKWIRKLLITLVLCCIIEPSWQQRPNPQCISWGWRRIGCFILPCAHIQECQCLEKQRKKWHFIRKRSVKEVNVNMGQRLSINIILLFSLWIRFDVMCLCVFEQCFHGFHSVAFYNSSVYPKTFFFLIKTFVIIIILLLSMQFFFTAK